MNESYEVGEIINKDKSKSYEVSEKPNEEKGYTLIDEEKGFQFNKILDFFDVKYSVEFDKENKLVVISFDN